MQIDHNGLAVAVPKVGAKTVNDARDDARVTSRGYIQTGETGCVKGFVDTANISSTFQWLLGN